MAKKLMKGIIIGGMSVLLAASGPISSIAPATEAAEQIQSIVTLNLNGGKLPEGTSLTFNAQADTVLPIPTRENYSFQGWYEDENFSGAAVTMLAAGSAQGNITYYAKWIPNQCNVTLNLNGGSLPDGAEPIHIPGTETPLPIPVYNGFSFGGWYLSETFAGEAVSTIPADASGDLVYYAKWSYTAKPTPQPSQVDKTLKAGTLATVGKSTYKVINGKKHTVTFIESYDPHITVPDTVRLYGAEYKVTAIAAKACKLNTNAKSIVIGKNVTSIGKQAFDGCSSLRKITVKSTALKSVGKKTLRGIHPKCIIKVPAGKYQTYKKLFKKKGQAGTVKIKKYM